MLTDGSGYTTYLMQYHSSSKKKIFRGSKITKNAVFFGGIHSMEAFLVPFIFENMAKTNFKFSGSITSHVYCKIENISGHQNFSINNQGVIMEKCLPNIFSASFTKNISWINKEIGKTQYSYFTQETSWGNLNFIK